MINTSIKFKTNDKLMQQDFDPINNHDDIKQQINFEKASLQYVKDEKPENMKKIMINLTPLRHPSNQRNSVMLNHQIQSNLYELTTLQKRRIDSEINRQVLQDKYQIQYKQNEQLFLNLNMNSR